MSKPNMFTIGLSFIITGIIFLVVGTTLVWLAHKAAQSFEPRPLNPHGHYIPKDIS